MTSVWLFATIVLVTTYLIGGFWLIVQWERFAGRSEVKWTSLTRDHAQSRARTVIVFAILFWPLYFLAVFIAEVTKLVADYLNDEYRKG
jgi:amino acid permease